MYTMFTTPFKAYFDSCSAQNFKIDIKNINIQKKEKNNPEGPFAWRGLYDFLFSRMIGYILDFDWVTKS